MAFMKIFLLFFINLAWSKLLSTTNLNSTCEITAPTVANQTYVVSDPRKVISWAPFNLTEGCNITEISYETILPEELVAVVTANISNRTMEA